MLQTTAASFDLHVYECLAPLLEPFLCGHPTKTQLVLSRSGAIDLQSYIETIDLAMVTHVVCTPTLLWSLAEHCDLYGTWEKLRHVQLWRTGGEALKQCIVNQVLPVLRQSNPSVSMWCSYGPAECTDTATMSRCEVKGVDTTAGQLVPIGRPLANYGSYVIVENEDDGPRSLHIARPGEVGMVYLSGPSVFNGYLKRSDLTQAALSLVNLESTGNEPVKLYRTGDLGKLLFDKSDCDPSSTVENLHFIGRADFAQVKIRGQRIETTEIEKVLMTHLFGEACCGHQVLNW